ncbi:MAG: hypothetical protein OJF48_000857 [Afipia sp.]|jgi:hypothetical protein|nr:MAG: hypothetical protein OJF48_000857 [Afipia sp.]
MTDQTLEDRVRKIIGDETLSAAAKDEALSNLIDIRIDQFGNFIFVRKGAPLDARDLTSFDRVNVTELRDRKRPAKRTRFLNKLNSPYKGPIILAEGDSWFEYPWPNIPDLIDRAGDKYAVLSLARAGDTWSDILDQDSNVGLPKRYPDGTLMGLFHTLNEATPKLFQYVMISAGGNDLIGNLKDCVYDFDPNRPGDEYIRHKGDIERPGFDDVLGAAIHRYREATSKVVAGGRPVILHTYDYPNPKLNGQYIGYQLKKFHKIEGEGLMRQILNQMIDLFYGGLKQIADASNGKIHLIDFRNTIGTDDYVAGPDDSLWNDEMHGNWAGFEKLWKKMDSELTPIFAKA